jgi:hypothetical protein
MLPNLDTFSTGTNMMLMVIILAVAYFVLKGKKTDKDDK